MGGRWVEWGRWVRVRCVCGWVGGGGGGGGNNPPPPQKTFVKVRIAQGGGGGVVAPRCLPRVRYLRVHIDMCAYTCVHTHSHTTRAHTPPRTPHSPRLRTPHRTHTPQRTATDVTNPDSVSIADRWDNYLVAAAELKDPTISTTNDTFHKCLGKVHSTLPNTTPQHLWALPPISFSPESALPPRPFLPSLTQLYIASLTPTPQRTTASTRASTRRTPCQTRRCR
jgi:hypothetical protein